MSEYSPKFWTELFGVFAAIGTAVWKFIQWLYGVDGRLKELERQGIESSEVHKEIRNTLGKLDETSTDLKAKVNLLIEGKIK